MKYFRLVFSVITALLVLTSCSDDPKEAPKADIFEVRNIGVLSTTEYTIGKIVQLNDEGNGTIGENEKILISCKAKVKAGIDLSQIQDEDIIIEGNTITIVLPKAYITTFTMDPNSIRTEMESVTGFRHNFTQEEKNNFLKQGEKAIREDLRSTEILNDAEKNAKLFLEDFFAQSGFEKVIIKHKETSDE